MRDLILGAAALTLLATTGCDQLDPLTRPYSWHESGVNQHNIAAMAANPADLIHGRNSQRHGAARESEAVEHVWSGKPVPLLGGSYGGGGSSGGGGGASGGGGGGASGGGSGSSGGGGT